MQRKIEQITLSLTTPASVIGYFIFWDKAVFAGIWIGAMVALIGFRMIIRFTKNLNLDEQQAKKQGTGSYVTRYFFYGIMIALCAYMGIPVLSVLAGMMCHKASLLIYSAVDKEDA